MINSETVMGQMEKIGPDHFKETLDQTYNHDRMVANEHYTEILSLIQRIANYSERQREKAPPTIIELSNLSGSQSARTYTASTPLRVQGVLITSNPTTDNIQLLVGLRKFNFFSPGYYPFPIEVQAGVDLSAADITTPASTAFVVYVIAYPAPGE